MQGNGGWRLGIKFCLAASVVLACSTAARSQQMSQPDASGLASSDPAAAIQALADSVRELRTEVQALNSQLIELRSEEKDERAEATELRRELDLAKSQSASETGASSNSNTPAAQDQTDSERISKLEDDQEMTEAKLNDQHQTKVESGSKYRVRLSGIALLNLYDNRGSVDNEDFPQMAVPEPPLGSASSFGGSLRQSQIGLEAFGPNIAGARTSANVKFDFAGGFPDTPNGAVEGLVRLRTGTIRFDWGNTSLVAGQDYLFFAPLAPTSFASLAIPALSYAGNLWGWVPQVRVEHRITLSETSSLLFEGGILDSLSGDSPENYYLRSPSWGEESGQPAYAGRISATRHIFGQDLTVGVGGYFGRQNWGVGRNIDAWAGTADAKLPLGRLFELSGEFYRGFAVGGLGGGIGQTVFLSGTFTAPTTPIYGLDSLGGWAQLKFKPMAKLELNGAFGQDNPFASELRSNSANYSIYSTLLARNRESFVNFIYHFRSDVLFSVEYDHLRTFGLDSSNAADHVNVSLGYLF